ncbi:MAG: FHA domain-containing protein [Burkholderiales bacterium]|nr:FHA domain-containing protein [Burkholderiales bacterium]
MHRQFTPKLAAASEEVGKLITAVELLLSDRGLPPPTCAWTGAQTAAVTRPNEGIRTTVFEPGRLSALAADAQAQADRLRAASADLQPPRTGPIDAADLPRGVQVSEAVLVFPWGSTLRLDHTVRIGRDPEFSPLARQLWADPRISRRHAELEPTGKGILLRDLGSSNGTYVGDEPLPFNGAALLDEDVQLHFGSNLAVKLVFLPPKPD